MADDIQSLEGKFQDHVNRAVKAKALRDDPLFIEAAEAVRDDLWQKFITADATNAPAVQALVLKVQCFNDFLLQFSRHMDSGKLAAHELKRLKEAKQTRKPRDPRFVRHRAT